jgi:hypothetical protein
MTSHDAVRQRDLGGTKLEMVVVEGKERLMERPDASASSSLFKLRFKELGARTFEVTAASVLNSLSMNDICEGSFRREVIYSI